MVTEGEETNRTEEERLPGWLALLQTMDRDGYADVRLDDVPEWVRDNSLRWAARFFRPGTGPYGRGLDVRHRVHRAGPDTIDALRHDYAVDGSLGLSVVESGSVVVSRIHGPAFDSRSEGGQRRAIDQAFGAVFRTWGSYADARGQQHPYHWLFEFGDAPVRSTTFSTQAALSPHRMQTWADRVDGMLDGADLCVLHFKCEPSSGGRKLVVDDRRWFEP
jgi:hypothetical protein